jgi:hypothetical protein
MNALELADKLEQGHWEGGTREQTAAILRKQAEEVEYWKSAFERAMTLYDQVKYLEAQVYGGTTK